MIPTWWRYEVTKQINFFKQSESGVRYLVITCRTFDYWCSLTVNCSLLFYKLICNPPCFYCSHKLQLDSSVLNAWLKQMSIYVGDIRWLQYRALLFILTFQLACSVCFQGWYLIFFSGVTKLMQNLSYTSLFPYLM